MGACGVCGKPLCALCVHFREGRVYCAEHVNGDLIPRSLAPEGNGEQTAPLPPGEGPGVRFGERHWSEDPRLEPLPMSFRPGWTEEALQPRPSTLAETLGLIGLVTGLVSLPFSFCCGFGAVIGAPLALAAGGMSVAALVTAPKSRNPSSARWTGGFGLGVSLLTLAVTVCFLGIAFNGGLGGLFLP